MNTFICDPFQIRRLERLVKRPLTAMERAGQMPVRFKSVNGDVMFERVKLHNLKEFYGK